MNNSDISNNSSNERRERIEQQTKLNTEANKNLFNINSNPNSFGWITNNINNKTNSNNMVNNMSNQINELISKNNNIKKPNYPKRITMAITKDNEYDFLNDDNNNNDINQNFNDNNLYNKNSTNIISDNLNNKIPKRNKKRITMAVDPFEENPNSLNEDLDQNPAVIVQIPNNSKKSYNKEIENSKNEELVYRILQSQAHNPLWIENLLN